MTRANSKPATAHGSLAADDTSARRVRGIALIAGAVLIVALIESGTIPFYWFPTLTGLTYLAAAAAGRSRGTLWAPGFVVTSVGLAAALWLRDGRCPTASSSSPWPSWRSAWVVSSRRCSPSCAASRSAR